MPFTVRRLRELIEYSKTEKYSLARKIIENMQRGVYTLPPEMDKFEAGFCGFCGSRLTLGSRMCPACGSEN